MQTWELLAHGVVQGVGFRWCVQMLAQKMGLAGTAKNNPDGTVTIVIQGTPTDLVKFKAALPEAAPYAKIYRLDTKVLPEMEQMHSFHVLY